MEREVEKVKTWKLKTEAQMDEKNGNGNGKDMTTIHRQTEAQMDDKNKREIEESKDVEAKYRSTDVRESRHEIPILSRS
jgi:hypothetical protein